MAKRTGISKNYSYGGTTFRYDYDRAIVMKMVKASAEDIREEKEWFEEHHETLLDIGEDGYWEANHIGLSAENWGNKAVRDEYLDEWISDMEYENEMLAANFVKYEMPYYSPSNPWDAPGMSVKDFI